MQYLNRIYVNESSNTILHTLKVCHMTSEICWQFQWPSFLQNTHLHLSIYIVGYSIFRICLCKANYLLLSKQFFELYQIVFWKLVNLSILFTLLLAILCLNSIVLFKFLLQLHRNQVKLNNVQCIIKPEF